MMEIVNVNSDNLDKLYWYKILYQKQLATNDNEEVSLSLDNFLQNHLHIDKTVFMTPDGKTVAYNILHIGEEDVLFCAASDTESYEYFINTLKKYDFLPIDNIEPSNIFDIAQLGGLKNRTWITKDDKIYLLE